MKCNEKNLKEFPTIKFYLDDGSLVLRSLEKACPKVVSLLKLAKAAMYN